MWVAFILISTMLFWVGAAIGSFLNVLIYRTVTDESWVTGRSHCDHCGQKIAWYDMIPVLSYLGLRGKCRSCHQPIAVTHPVVEGLIGALFVWWYWVGSLFFQLTMRPLSTLQPLFWLVVGVVLLAILVADLIYMIIPDVLVFTLLAVTILYRVVLIAAEVMQPIDMVWAIFGMALVVSLFTVLWAGTHGKGMGLGDVKLVAPMSLLLGWPNILVGIFLAFIMGAVVGVGLMVAGKRKMGQVIPFGPFLVIATGLTLIWGDTLVTWYSNLL